MDDMLEELRRAAGHLATLAFVFCVCALGAPILYAMTVWWWRFWVE